MENKRKALGKGLEQLFSNERIDFENFEQTIVEEAKQNDIVETPLINIRSNPYQPREYFDEQALKELADSIKEHGVVQPIIVKKSIKGYEIIAGERRTRAAKMAGLDKIPAIIREFNDQEMMEIALIENIQRENLNPIEEAEAFAKIIENNNFTQEQVAQKFGKSRSHITNLLGLLNLPQKAKELVKEQKISMGHAKVLSKISDEDLVNELADKIITEGLSVREIERLTTGGNTPKKNPVKKTPVFSAKHTLYESLMREYIGSKVKISSKKIEIPYSNDEELDRILETLGISVEGE